jgi:predicted nucleotidyltransferase component of viral defense system
VIPRAHITAWRASAPWSMDEQVEQDLVLSRALVELFSDQLVADELAFRGGTALHKLFVQPPCRYSEDIDLVQLRAGPIGPLLHAARARLDPWLGTPRHKRGHSRVTLYYRYDSTFEPVQRMRLKVEINTREHFSVFGIAKHVFEVKSPWFSGSASLSTYHLDELLGTKLRALYQRRKGRDLFDLWDVQRRTAVDGDRVVECFRRYVDHAGHRVSRAEFEANLAAKLSDPRFLEDVAPLLASGSPWDVEDAARYARAELLVRLPGDAWRGEAQETEQEE